MRIQPPPHFAAFERQLKAVEGRLRARLEEVRARLHHPGSKGTSAEAAFRLALSEYLPRRISVGHGEVIDARGNRSAQCDVVLASDFHPNWFTGDEPSLFLIEAVAAAGEVKSVLTPADLTKCLDDVRRFRQLRPDWGGHTEIVATESDLRRFYRSPPYILFAYESQLSLETITERLQAATDDSGGRTTESIDGVFVLDRGFVLNFGDGKGAFVTQGSNGVRLTQYYWDDEMAPLVALMMWLPTALALPLAQLPVLARYLLTDASLFPKQTL